MIKISPIVLLILLLSTFQLMAGSIFNEEKDRSEDTTISKHNSLFLGLSGGFQQFYGDVHHNTYFPGSHKEGSMSWYGGLRLGYNFNQYWGLQGMASYGKLYAENEMQTRYFDAMMIDYQLEVLLNITSLVAPKIYEKRWFVFTNIGIGGLHHRTGLYHSSDNTFITGIGYHTDGSKDKLNFERSVTMGAGFDYRLTKRLDIGIEIKLYRPGFDELDAVYKALSELDQYSHTGLQLTYTFGKNADSWKWNPKDLEHEMILRRIEALEEEMDTVQSDIAALKKCKCRMDNLPDEDGDGVPDEYDLEPNTPSDQVVNFQGISIPTRLAFDTLEKKVDGSGTDRLMLPEGMAFTSIYFALDKSDITSDSYKEITRVAMYMKANPTSQILISGNCDLRASDAYNDALSGRRTKAAYDVLVEEFDIDPSRLSRENLGKKELLSAQHHINRRVDFFVR